MKCSLIKRGDKWSVTYNEKMEDGTYKKVWISTGEEKKKDAEKKLTEIQHQLDNQMYIKRNNMTLKELTDIWMEVYTKPNLEETTSEGYKIIINKYILPYFKDVEVQKITALNIDKYYVYLQKECISVKYKKGLSPNTVHRHHAIFCGLFKFAKAKKIIKNNIIEDVTVPSKTKYKAGIFDEKEVKVLFEKVENNQNEALIHLAVGLGLRLSEICGLRWNNIDFEKSYIHIVSARVRKSSGGDIIKKTKNESSTRSILAPQQLMKILLEAKEKCKEFKIAQNSELLETDLVIMDEDGKILHPSTLSHRFSDFLKDNNLKKLRLHDMRHTNTTLMLKNKVDWSVIQSRNGWADAKMIFSTYGHVLNEMAQEADEKISNAIYK